MRTEPPQSEPALLRVSYRVLERLRQAYPKRFDPTIQALRIRCRMAYRDSGRFGLLAAWMAILWQLQVTLPQTMGLPSLWQLLLAKRGKGTRPVTMPLLQPRAGVRLYYRRRRPSRRELFLSSIALLVLLLILFGLFESDAHSSLAHSPAAFHSSVSSIRLLSKP